jgi:hypothetical protein
MTTLHWKNAGFAGVLGLALAIACSGKARNSAPASASGGSDTTVDAPDSATPDQDAADLDAADLDAGDACVPTPTKKCRPATFIYLGSKCLTKCPLHNLTCDPRFWKGNCTHSCMTDADCQDTGSPGVCGVDNQCYRPCTPGPKPCSRTMYECVGDAGHTYCASDVPNPHLDGGADAADFDAADDGGQ